METCPSKELFSRTLHPYSKALLSAIPSIDIDKPKQRIQLKGELMSPINPKPGCRFVNRCPYAKERCHQEVPPYEEVLPEHFTACHYIREINQL